MIEIIKRGTKEIADCKTCGCQFTYEKEDVVNKSDGTYKGFKEYVICPQCYKEVILRQSR